MTVETINVNDSTRIRIEQDSDSINPLKNWDHDATVYVYSDRRIECITENESIPDLTADQISGNLDDLESIIDEIDSVGLEDGYEDAVIDNVNERIVDAIQNTTNPIHIISTVFSIARHPVLTRQDHGYCQSHWHNILVVLPTDHDATNPVSFMESIANEYRYWAYGDCYGYILETKKQCECCGNIEWQTIDSCWGFYGDRNSDGWNYMIESAKESIQ